MSKIDDVLDSIKGEALEMVKEQLKDLLAAAKAETDAVVRETGQKIQHWLLLRAQGELSDEELQALLYSRDQLLRQYKNTLDIKARARFEKIAVALVNLVLDKLVGLAFA